MKWVITKNHLDGKNGFGNFKGDPSTLPVRFKLYDDDGELYYEGRASEEDFAPLDWAMAYAGCTIMKTSTNGKPFQIL